MLRLQGTSHVRLPMFVRRLFERRSMLAVMLAAMVCSVPSGGFAAPAPYAVDVILPMTGVAAFLGRSISASLAVVEDSINKAGGIHGRPIKFVVADDASNPQVAVQLVNGIIARKPAVMIGSSLSATCGAVAPLLKDGPVDFCLSPGIHPAEGTFVFSPAPSTVDMATGTAHFMRYKGWKKVAFIFSTDSSGQDGERTINEAFGKPENKDVAIIDVEHFAVTDLTVAAQMARIKASGAQALYVWSSGTASLTVLRAAQDAALNLPIVTSYSNATYDQMKAYQPVMPKELYFTGLPTIAPDMLPKGALRNTVDAYHRAFRAKGIRPEVGQQTVCGCGPTHRRCAEQVGDRCDGGANPRLSHAVARLGGSNGHVRFPDLPAAWRQLEIGRRRAVGSLEGHVGRSRSARPLADLDRQVGRFLEPPPLLRRPSLAQGLHLPEEDAP